MAIDFNRQMVFDPKIDIVGKEVPLEALDRTSTELQSRYDKSYENETKTQALAKKLMQDVAPEDEEVAKQAFDLYQTRLKERADKGDYHSMRWQTLQDATDFTNIYSGLSTKAKQLQEYKDKIATYDKIADPERKAFEIEKWKKSQSKTKFDPENRTLSGLGVSAPSLVDDGNMAEFANKFGTGIIANLTGRSNKNDKWFSKGEKLPNGQTALMDAIYDVSTSTQISEVTPGRVKSVVQNFLKADPDMMAYQQAMAEFYLDKGKGQITPEQAMQQAKDYIENSATQAAISKFANKQVVTANATGINEAATNAYSKGKEITDPNGRFTQRLSNIFSYDGGNKPFEVDKEGNIISTAKSLNASITGAPAYAAGTYAEDFKKLDTLRKQGQAAVEGSTEYKRLKSHLTSLGALNDGASKKEVNEAIVNFWNNEIADAQSSIAVAEPGDKAANDYIAEMNRAILGTPTPDDKTTGNSLKNGQMAQAKFTDEKGKPLTSQEVIAATKDDNVRINGWVNQYTSPFEYGSSYMVAAGPNGEQKHYLIEPDLNTKNSGAYFANRIFNSTRQKNLVSKWKDGTGVNYEATPVKGGKSFLIYLQEDDKNPINLSNEEVGVLSQYPAGIANQLIQQMYLAKKESKNN